MQCKRHCTKITYDSLTNDYGARCCTGELTSALDCDPAWCPDTIQKQPCLGLMRAYCAKNDNITGDGCNKICDGKYTSDSQCNSAAEAHCNKPGNMLTSFCQKVCRDKENRPTWCDTSMRTQCASIAALDLEERKIKDKNGLCDCINSELIQYGPALAMCFDQNCRNAYQTKDMVQLSDCNTGCTVVQKCVNSGTCTQTAQNININCSTTTSADPSSTPAVDPTQKSQDVTQQPSSMRWAVVGILAWVLILCAVYLWLHRRTDQ